MVRRAFKNSGVLQVAAELLRNIGHNRGEGWLSVGQ
jgi:hypothetical protein